MFVEHKEQGEAVPVKVGALKLSEAIRAGIATVPETIDYCGCALGAAYTYITGGDLQVDQFKSKHQGSGYKVVADMFQVPYEIAYTASKDHQFGHRSRTGCADWLESQGY